MRPCKERRGETRQLCSEFVQIAWLDDCEKRIAQIGLLEDIGSCGLAVSMNVAVPVGRKVHVHARGFEGEAEVRYCELGDYSYLVGMEFAEGYSWDRGKWRPNHLYEAATSSSGERPSRT